MDVFRSPSSGQGAGTEVAPSADPRLRPTPDFGTLGPHPDNAAGGTYSGPDPIQRVTRSKGIAPFLAAGIGILAAVVAVNIGKTHAAWARFADLFPSAPGAPASVKDLHQLDRMRPQKQAETLLELAVGHNDGAVDQISSRVDRWHGKVQWNSQIASLSTAALNSNDMRVRQSGVEVELAAYGLRKNSASLSYLLKCAESPDHAQKIWALWALGLMGNRGVESDRVVQALTAHLKDADMDSRRWAVEGLALVGAGQTIEPLLKTMHDDPAPLVRERAACSLAESGMFTQEQRIRAVPQLLNYTDDPALDAQTHGWAFQALRDITRQRLPNDSAAWRSWYENQ